MSLRQRYLKILSGIVPIGAAGVSLLLGSTAPAAADLGPAAAQPRAADALRVAERLAAIREAVSDAAGPEANTAEPRPQLAWWAWRNGGGGWRNGGGGWRNGGGGGWRNGGWHNGWHNYWHNW
jgi:rSAM-associated Gly-rich repeat protein